MCFGMTFVPLEVEVRKIQALGELRNDESWNQSHSIREVKCRCDKLIDQTFHAFAKHQ